MSGSAPIRVVLPQHLRTLANVDSEVLLTVGGPVTVRSILDALENRYPMLCGTIRDHVTREHRPKLRFYANEEDIRFLDNLQTKLKEGFAEQPLKK